MRKRPTWDEMFIKIAQEVAERSTCCRIQVGSVLVKNNRIISIGYNGSHPTGQHCDEHWEEYFDSYPRSGTTLDQFLNSENFFKMHHEWAEKNEIHAEQNCIIAAAKTGISTDGSTLYVTYSPCVHCAKIISQAGIISVKYLIEYERDSRGIEFLKECGIECIKIAGGE